MVSKNLTYDFLSSSQKIYQIVLKPSYYISEETKKIKQKPLQKALLLKQREEKLNLN